MGAGEVGKYLKHERWIASWCTLKVLLRRQEMCHAGKSIEKDTGLSLCKSGGSVGFGGHMESGGKWCGCWR